MRFSPCATLHIYSSQASHKFVEESSSIQYSTYCMIEEHKAQHVPIYEELCHNSTSFTPFLLKSSTDTIHRVYFQETTSLLPKGIDNNTIFLLQKCDTFDWTTKGRTWMTSQDHTDFTQLSWSPQSNYTL